MPMCPSVLKILDIWTIKPYLARILLWIAAKSPPEVVSSTVPSIGAVLDPAALVRWLHRDLRVVPESDAATIERHDPGGSGNCRA